MVLSCLCQVRERKFSVFYTAFLRTAFLSIAFTQAAGETSLTPRLPALSLSSVLWCLWSCFAHIFSLLSSNGGCAAVFPSSKCYPRGVATIAGGLVLSQQWIHLVANWHVFQWTQGKLLALLTEATPSTKILPLKPTINSNFHSFCYETLL